MTTAARRGRPALAMNLELSYGRPGASARVELHGPTAKEPGEAPGAPRVARVALRGCIDGVAARRLAEAVDELAVRGIEQVRIDCGELRHIDFRHVPVLMSALERFERRAGPVALSGLSRYLRDLFRLAGGASRLPGWPWAGDPPGAPAGAREPSRERAP